MEIQGYPNYLIHEHGVVQNKKTGRYLKTGDNGCGYRLVTLSNGETRKTMTVHRLVASHYIPNPTNKEQIDHIDRNRANNDISNLRWATRQENMFNIGLSKNNTSGHKNITPIKGGGYLYQKMYQRKKVHRSFKTLNDALCFKFCHLLKLNVHANIVST